MFYEVLNEKRAAAHKATIFDSPWMKKEARSALRDYLAKEMTKEVGRKTPSDFGEKLVYEAQRVAKGIRMAKRAPGGKITPEYAQAHITENREATLKYLSGLSMEELRDLSRGPTPLKRPAKKLYEAARTKTNKRTAVRESAEDILAKGPDLYSNPDFADFDLMYREGFKQSLKKSKKVRGGTPESRAKEADEAKAALKQRLAVFEGRKEREKKLKKLGKERVLRLARLEHARERARLMKDTEARIAKLQREQEALEQQLRARREAPSTAASSAKGKQNREQYEEHLKKNPSPTSTPSAPRPTPSTPKPASSTPKPASSTPRPTPSTPRPTPSAPKPASSTPKPASSTPRPTPSASKPEKGMSAGTMAALGIGVPAVAYGGYRALRPSKDQRKQEKKTAAFVQMLS